MYCGEWTFLIRYMNVFGLPNVLWSMMNVWSPQCRRVTIKPDHRLEHRQQLTSFKLHLWRNSKTLRGFVSTILLVPSPIPSNWEYRDRARLASATSSTERFRFVSYLRTTARWKILPTKLCASSTMALGFRQISVQLIWKWKMEILLMYFPTRLAVD